MPVDHFKMSIVANTSLYLSGRVKHYPSRSSDGARVIRISRPLGLLRKPKQQKQTKPRSAYLPNILASEDAAYVTDEEEEINEEEANMQRDGEGEDNHNSYGNSKLSKSPTSSLSKNRIFENRYKLALARSPRTDSKIRPVTSLYSKRVVYLPMFRINMERYTAPQNDQKDVLCARQSLRELLDQGMTRRKPNTAPVVMSPSVQNYQFKSPGRESEEKGEYTPRRLVYSSPITIPKAEEYVEVDHQEHKIILDKKRFSICDSEDTDRMDVRIENLDISSVDNSTFSEVNSDFVPSNAPEKSSNGSQKNVNGSPSYNGKGKTSNSDSSSTSAQKQSVDGRGKYQYKRITNIRAKTGSDKRSAVWPSYSDVKSMSPRQRKQTNGSRPGSASSSVRRSASVGSSAKSSPVLKYTNRGTVLKLEPIIVPSHTNMTCPRCNIYNRERETTPCPPNSPLAGQALEMLGEDSDSCDEEHDHEHGHTKQHSHSVQKSVQSKRNSQEVYVMPKVTVKILETRQQLNDAKLNYTKSFY